ncbi:dTDP-4-dehydrorhamnose reductase [Sagittula sp. SSi028]|uniref:dTDP-4-dehydrorhamnose reductase n=1 Tax=Sagittula sp. SSi028 TaxID=3400636 RepID=UPI003AF86EC9
MILIFGRNGQVAQELARKAPALRGLGRAQVNLLQPGAAAQAIADHSPNVVINASAYTAVDRAETETAEAQQLNSEAPAEMARTCAERGIPFLHVSTDYIFDGSGSLARSETDPVGPLNVYGHSKLAGEDAVRASGAQALILRTSWVFSAHGGNFVKTMLRLSESRDALSIVSDQIGGPTPAADIAATLLTCARAMQAGQAGGTYHYSGGPAVSWADFAREIFRQAGRHVRVTDIPTADYPTPAARPLNSRLNCAKLKADFGITQPDWQAGLAATLKELGL